MGLQDGKRRRIHSAKVAPMSQKAEICFSDPIPIDFFPELVSSQKISGSTEGNERRKDWSGLNVANSKLQITLTFDHSTNRSRLIDKLLLHSCKRRSG